MKKLILIAIISILVIFAVNGCKRREENDLRFVEYVKIIPAKQDKRKEFFGYIQAGGEVKLGFEISGIIQRIYVNDGQKVKKGQIIATIDNELNEIEEREMRAALKNAYVNYEHAKNYFERVNKLHAVGGISDNNMDKAKTDMETRKEEIEISEDKLLQAKKRASYGKIRAPRDGVIVKKLTEEGNYTNAGNAVVIFQDNRNTEAKIFVSEKYINKIQNGATLEIKAEEINETPLIAKIKSITTTSIEEGSYRVTVEFDRKYTELKDGVGIKAFMEFENRNNKEVIVVPATSILEDEISSYVWVLEILKEKGNEEIAKIKKQKVEVIEISDNKAVIEGVRRNDLVVTKGSEEVMEGQKVKIKAEKEISADGARRF